MAGVIFLSFAFARTLILAQMTKAPTTPKAATNSYPCDQASDFLGTKFGLCDQATIAAQMPSSATECAAKLSDGSTKASRVKLLYAHCCKPGSKPNEICGTKRETATPCKAKSVFLPDAKVSSYGDTTCFTFQQRGEFNTNANTGNKNFGDTPYRCCRSTQIPCDRASDFDGKTIIPGYKPSDAKTCAYYAAHGMLPESVEECDDTWATATKDHWLRGLWGKCCKPGSKPNGICGFDHTTVMSCAASDFQFAKNVPLGVSGFFRGPITNPQTCQDMLAVYSLYQSFPGGSVPLSRVQRYVGEKCCKSTGGRGTRPAARTTAAAAGMKTVSGGSQNNYYYAGSAVLSLLSLLL